MGDREKNIYFAKLAEQGERYDKMADYMKEVCHANQPLSVEERNLLSVAFKNAVGSRRASWRIIATVEAKESQKGSTANVTHVKNYRNKVEAELNDICNDILGVLDAKLIPTAGDAEAQVFYNKMKGDYFRYTAEFTEGEKKEVSANKAKLAYEDAMAAATGLAVTHPIRLGLALNFSVFLYEVVANPEEACKMARQAFEDAIAELDNVSEESYKDSTLIMQLLRDNLTLWTADQEPPPEP